MPAATLRYRVILGPEEQSGFNVIVPAFPEIHTCGDNREDALAMARDAIELALAYYRDEGREAPPSGRNIDRRPLLGGRTKVASIVGM